MPTELPEIQKPLTVKSLEDFKAGQKAQNIEDFTDLEYLDNLYASMAEVLRETGAGVVTANQLGIDLNFFVCYLKTKKPDANGKDRLFYTLDAFCNPVIKSIDPETEWAWERVLTFDPECVNVARPKSLVLQFQTITGVGVEVNLEGDNAKIVQQAYEWLMGITPLDRLRVLLGEKMKTLTPADLLEYVNNWNELEKQFRLEEKTFIYNHTILTTVEEGVLGPDGLRGSTYDQRAIINGDPAGEAIGMVDIEDIIGKPVAQMQNGVFVEVSKDDKKIDPKVDLSRGRII